MPYEDEGEAPATDPASPPAAGTSAAGAPAADRAPAPAPAAGSAPAGRPPLSARELAVLAVERQGWSGPGAKERAVREQLDISPTRYYQILNALLDDVRAEAHDPVTVHRLRRVRAERRERH
ncbi:DUF3263 domain-containing protein [Streptomyces sp. NPDC004111]|uniref:DUF3263 domain-containing protein n=1 Tax=Streptomyces sp. NPDC004111 TaxID=3364690 RepID=UPI0036802763